MAAVMMGVFQLVCPGFRGLGILDSWAARAWRRLSWGVADTHQSFVVRCSIWSRRVVLSPTSRDLEISGQTNYAWRHQDRIDKGLEPGLTSAEKAELGTAARIGDT